MHGQKSLTAPPILPVLDKDNNKLQVLFHFIHPSPFYPSHRSCKPLLLQILTFAFLQVLFSLLEEARQVYHNPVPCGWAVQLWTVWIGNQTNENIVDGWSVREGQPTNKWDSLLVEHSTGQQVEVILHRVHHHRVSCIVSTLQRETQSVTMEPHMTNIVKQKSHQQKQCERLKLYFSRFNVGHGRNIKLAPIFWRVWCSFNTYGLRSSLWPWNSDTDLRPKSLPILPTNITPWYRLLSHSWGTQDLQPF